MSKEANDAVNYISSNFKPKGTAGGWIRKTFIVADMLRFLHHLLLNNPGLVSEFETFLLLEKKKNDNPKNNC